MNVSSIMAFVAESRLATLHELQTVYGYEDLMDLYEILIVRTENERRAARPK